MIAEQDQQRLAMPVLGDRAVHQFIPVLAMVMKNSSTTNAAEQQRHDPRPLALALADDLVLEPHHGRNRSATSTANKANR